MNSANYDRNLMEENLLATSWLAEIAAWDVEYLLQSTWMRNYVRYMREQWPDFKYWWVAYCYKYNIALACGEGE